MTRFASRLRDVASPQDTLGVPVGPNAAITARNMAPSPAPQGNFSFDGRAWFVGAFRSNGARALAPTLCVADGSTSAHADVLYRLGQRDLLIDPYVAAWRDQVWVGGSVGAYDPALHAGARGGGQLTFSAGALTEPTGRVHGYRRAPAAGQAGGPRMYVQQELHQQRTVGGAVNLGLSFMQAMGLARYDHVRQQRRHDSLVLDQDAASWLMQHHRGVLWPWLRDTACALVKHPPLRLPSEARPTSLRHGDQTRSTAVRQHSWFAALGAVWFFAGRYHSRVHELTLRARQEGPHQHVTVMVERVGSRRWFGVVPGGLVADQGTTRPQLQAWEYRFDLRKPSDRAACAAVRKLALARQRSGDDRGLEAALTAAAQHAPVATESLQDAQQTSHELGLLFGLFPMDCWRQWLPRGFGFGLLGQRFENTRTHVRRSVGSPDSSDSEAQPSTLETHYSSGSTRLWGPRGEQQDDVLATVPLPTAAPQNQTPGDGKSQSKTTPSAAPQNQTPGDGESQSKTTSSAAPQNEASQNKTTQGLSPQSEMKTSAASQNEASQNKTAQGLSPQSEMKTSAASQNEASQNETAQGLSPQTAPAQDSDVLVSLRTQFSRSRATASMFARDVVEPINRLFGTALQAPPSGAAVASRHASVAWALTRADLQELRARWRPQGLPGVGAKPLRALLAGLQSADAGVQAHAVARFVQSTGRAGMAALFHAVDGDLERLSLASSSNAYEAPALLADRCALLYAEPPHAAQGRGALLRRFADVDAALLQIEQTRQQAQEDPLLSSPARQAVLERCHHAEARLRALLRVEAPADRREIKRVMRGTRWRTRQAQRVLEFYDDAPERLAHDLRRCLAHADSPLYQAETRRARAVLAARARGLQQDLLLDPAARARRLGQVEHAWTSALPKRPGWEAWNDVQRRAVKRASLWERALCGGAAQRAALQHMNGKTARQAQDLQHAVGTAPALPAPRAWRRRAARLGLRGPDIAAALQAAHARGVATAQRRRTAVDRENYLRLGPLDGASDLRELRWRLRTLQRMLAPEAAAQRLHLDLRALPLEVIERLQAQHQRAWRRDAVLAAALQRSAQRPRRPQEPGT